MSSNSEPERIACALRPWLGVALLAASWLVGSGYYHAPTWPVWGLLVLGGALGLARHTPTRTPLPVALGLTLLLVPCACVLPWPYAVIPIFLLTASWLSALPLPVAWPRGLGRGLGDAAALLAVQGLGLSAYEALTARSHELPAPLARLLAAVAHLLGMEVAYNGHDLALGTIRKTHLLGPTWELLLDPATLAFLIGGLTLLALRPPSPRASPPPRPTPVSHLLHPLCRFLVLLLAWLPLRAALLMALYLHRALLTDYEAAFNLMNQFWSSGLLATLLAGPLALAWRFVPVPAPDAPPPAPLRVPHLAALAALAFAAALITAGIVWSPIGAPKPGRVLVDEYHSTWEPTTRPFDTEWYGQKAGYNYACIYDYASRFFDMGRLTNRIDSGALAACDVLVLKVPTSAYETDEVQSVIGFVERGGGLLLVGEHTDVFLTSTHLNQIARLLDFEFRSDCVFSIDGKFEQHVDAPAVPHPVRQHVPPIDMAVSCSIVPHGSGRAVQRATGLWNLPADYHASNFYPQLEDRADTRYGAFIQIWSTRHGRGRVLAFTDSTIFSNFSTFEPGKSELMLGMLDWLNHTERGPDPRPWLVLAGLIVGLLAGRQLLGRTPVALALAVLLAGVVATAWLVRAHHAQAMPPLPPKRPFTQVVIDRTLSRAPLSLAGFIKSTPEGFGIFDQWILRLGYFTRRATGPGAFTGNLLVVFEPDQDVTDAYRDGLVDYVQAGGKLLVLDSARNTNSVANSLLQPFGLSTATESAESGTLEPVPADWPRVPAEGALRVKGGIPLARMNGEAVAAYARHGKGTVVLLGCGGRFNDDNMGISTDLEPTPATRAVFDLQFAILRAIVDDQLPAAP
ncbi:MAG: DUF4350 domain-containing protein [Lentisphaerae bacterium]|nr:DUF4350 domain-containing protein [Lentisphaerota bacterium]